MKQLTSLLTVLALILTFNLTADAQPGTGATVEVVESLSFTSVSDVHFGQVLASNTTDVTLDPNGTDSNLGGTATAGKLVVTGTDTASVVISFGSPTNITDGANQIGYTGNFSGDSTDTQGTSLDLSSGTNSVTLNPGTGKYYIYYGGTLAGGDIQSAGPAWFSGTISTTVTYE